MSLMYALVQKVNEHTTSVKRAKAVKFDMILCEDKEVYMDHLREIPSLQNGMWKCWLLCL